MTLSTGYSCSRLDFRGGQAIELRDPETNLRVGAAPEWDAAGRNEVAAYLKATRPNLRVIFQGTPAANGVYTVGADGVPFQVEELQVDLVFDPVTGCSAPQVFQANGPLPDAIGLHPAKLDWYVRTAPSPSVCPPVGTSTHSICTSWKAMTEDDDQDLETWVYEPIMRWTCEWAAGCDDEKAICDAIIRNVESSGLRYGLPLRVFDNVRAVLRNGGGMCGDWYMVFQQMAHSQGVFVHRRAFMTEWRVLPNGEEYWCAIVICRGGLNQPRPTHDESEFHDNHTGFPIAGQIPLLRRWQHRYRFWGRPRRVDDGHCVNFLEYGGDVYLYDACFGVGPILLPSGLPVADENVTSAAADVSAFRASYLDNAVDYMLGSVYNGPDFHRTFGPPDVPPEGQNGMTVRTRDIPPLVNGLEGVTLRWSE